MMRKMCILVGVLLLAGLVQAVGVVGYWDFEEGGTLGAGATTYDRSGVSPAIDLTLQTAAQIVYDSDRGSYVLDPRPGLVKDQGVGGAVGALDSGSKLDTPKVFTLSVWVRPRNEPNDLTQGYAEQHGSIVSDDGNEDNRHNLRSNNSALKFTKEPPGWDNRLEIWRGNDWDPGYLWWDGTGPWHHLLVTSDGAKFYGYIDGVFRGEMEHSPTVFLDLYLNWKIGAGTTHQIDDVAMFDGYCPAASAEGLYDGTYTVFDVPLEEYTPIPATCNDAYAGDPNLLAWYHFEEGPGATTTADLAVAYPPADADASYEEIPGCPPPMCPAYEAEIQYDSSDLPFHTSSPAGNVFAARKIDPTRGTYFYASGEKFNDPNITIPGGFTLSAWIKPDDSGNGQGHASKWGLIASKGGWDGMFSLNLEKSGLHGVIRYRYPDGLGGEVDSQTRWDTPDDLTVPDQWNHVVMVWDPNSAEPSEMNFYVNGWPQPVSISKTTPEGSHLWDPHPDEPFVIGGTVYNSGDLPNSPDIIYEPFEGDIDDVRLYNRPLTADEIACLWQRTCLKRQYTGADCFADMADFSDLASQWQAPYDIVDLTEMAAIWITQQPIFPDYGP